jgi:hypothetical protein
MSAGRDSGGCFFDGLMDLMEFAARYRRLGRLGFDDWQIVSEVASAVSKMLREGRVRGCPNTEDMIVNIVVRTLDDLGIDRYSITRAYMHGTPKDVEELLKRIFPNLGKTGRTTQPGGEEYTIPIEIEPAVPAARHTTRKVNRSSSVGDVIVMILAGIAGGTLYYFLMFHGLASIVRNPVINTVVWALCVLFTIILIIYLTSSGYASWRRRRLARTPNSCIS